MNAEYILNNLQVIIEALTSPQGFVEFTYTNYKGVTARRRVVFLDISYGLSDYHNGDKHWIVDSFDLDKMKMRSFAVKDIQFDTRAT